MVRPESFLMDGFEPKLTPRLEMTKRTEKLLDSFHSICQFQPVLKLDGRMKCDEVIKEASFRFAQLWNAANGLRRVSGLGFLQRKFLS